MTYKTDQEQAAAAGLEVAVAGAVVGHTEHMVSDCRTGHNKQPKPQHCPGPVYLRKDEDIFKTG